MYNDSSSCLVFPTKIGPFPVFPPEALIIARLLCYTGFKGNENKERRCPDRHLFYLNEVIK